MNEGIYSIKKGSAVKCFLPSHIIIIIKGTIWRQLWIYTFFFFFLSNHVRFICLCKIIDFKNKNKNRWMCEKVLED